MVCGVESLSRRRSKNPTKAISITLKQSTLDKLDQVLTWKQSRSKYIQHTIEKYLENQLDDVDAFPTRDLLFELLYRKVLNNQMYHMLLNTISEDA